ncbi:DNA polymerase III subunit alpha [Bermanella marisrubri]|uniref:DNA polymerase III subunit alpha n=1 Tax=Bermanella marisrubri TaxID=207949 RepID=Q1MY95_9GAMM|nr:DNA polymerase III subunit alpha [Bermanella marisrubri]EAT10972.1 DNA polymerase III, alpha subunit [Oceanobacter sp. RED65] [Bermanella marisrubri]QIZ85119.1 DNA polymerase III subunit alpha [Bermanella marisrubri]
MSNNNSFVHLRVHTEYSLVDGIVRVKELIKAADADQQIALTISDQSNMFALVKFYTACQATGIKPIISADVFIENPDDMANPYAITLIAQNDVGYRNLTELVSAGFTKNQHHDRAQLKQEWFEEKADGLIALSGFQRGDIEEALKKDKFELAASRLDRWLELFPQRFYLELQRTQRPNDEALLQKSIKLAADKQVPVVATNDVRFMKQDDFDAHEARVCIGEGMTLIDPRRERRYSDQQYFKTQQQMCELFEDIPSAITNSVEIATRCNVQVLLGKYFLPEYPIPDGLTENEFFKKISYEGLEERLEFLIDKNDPQYEEVRKAYFDRLDFELDIIIQMGFPGYFLIVMDFIQWAKDHDIPVGPGRGSGAGSLVAYAQKITDIDPLEYDLLFERFLNPERVSMPDFDIDFCMEKRDRVISYVADNYGREAVSQIVTYGTMAAKAVVRDVARVQGKSYGLADKLSKLIPGDPGMTLAKALDEEPALGEFIDSDEEAQEIWEMAQKLEGITRQTGKHAGGVVIAPTKLTDFSPTLCEEDGTGLVTQFDKNDVETAGLVKFDFLGLRTLTIIDWALNTINDIRAKNNEEPLRIEEIPLDDAPSYKLLKEAKTTAVFQLESRGMKDLIRRLEPDNIEEMIALVALFRPGPLESGMVDDFINRKHGRAEVAYPHPDYQHESLKEILEPTYGVIVYQEQVMQIAQVLAGYTLGGADMLRRAMGKKKPEEMAKQRETFREGAASIGNDPDLAMKIFDLVEKFAGYGFNKSHSAAYAVVSYQTLWLKTHYPAPFMAAVLTSDMQNTDKVVIFIEECREMGLDLVLPDVNESEYGFTVNDSGAIVYGLGAVKGVGEGPIEAIITARKEKGPFTDLFHFCKSVDKSKINKRVLEALVRCGAFDKIGPNRSVLFASIEDALKAADQSAKNAAAGMMDMFGVVEEEANINPYDEYKNKVRDWTPKQKLKGEKDTLGLYVTGHPFDEYETELKNIARTRLANIQADKKPQKIAGIVVDQRVMKTKRGGNMAIVTIDDRTARMDVRLFSDIYEQYKDKLLVDHLLIMEVEVKYDNYNDSLGANLIHLWDVTQARAIFSQGVKLTLNYAKIDRHLIRSMTEKLAPFNVDGAQVLVDYVGPQAKARLQLGQDYKVEANDDLLYRLQHEFGDDNVEVVYESA